ncbi:MAG: hypothetical protein H0W87_01625 [Actinobacteria bacterium]|nr:hypothetical protein [Actinomycetota bacterium]
MRRVPGFAIAILAAAGLAAGTAQSRPSKLPFVPANSSARIDNRYWPMKPGSRWVYREGAARVDVTVLSRTEKILGIETRVVHDVKSENGRVIEDTYDWYAEDRKGNVWYMGEATKEYGNGRIDTAGSWRAGVHGARPGVIVPAHPRIGVSYHQEYLEGQAEDNARNLSVDEQVGVPQGHYNKVFMTRETTPLEPKLLEYKFYAPDVGPVLAVAVSPKPDTEQLVSFRRGG